MTPVNKNIRAMMLLALLALPALGWAQAGCLIVPRGELPLEPANGRFLVAAEINHKRTMMLVASGSSRASLNTAIADNLLLSQPQNNTTTVSAFQRNRTLIVLREHENKEIPVSGMGGKISRLPYVVPSLTVGPVTLMEHEVIPSNLTMPSTTGNQIPIGAIGSDVLSRYDVELDFPNKIMRWVLGSKHVLTTC